MKRAQDRQGGFVLACFLLLAFANCGGGGGGSDSGGGSVVADFAAACLSGNACFNNSVTLQKGAASGNIVQVQAVLNKLSTTIGEASLVIDFDPTVAQFQAFTEGAAFGPSSCGSPPCTTYLVNASSGEVVVDIVPPAGGKSISSAQVMVTLTFKVLKVGTTNLTFKNPDNAINSSALFRPDTTVIILGSSGWSGGLMSGT